MHACMLVGRARTRPQGSVDGWRGGGGGHGVGGGAGRAIMHIVGIVQPTEEVSDTGAAPPHLCEPRGSAPSP